MTPWMIWIALAAILAVLEMMSGTFYLLVLALGAAAGAAVAGLHASGTFQIAAAAIVTALGWALLYKFGPHLSRRDAAGNPDVNSDIGATVRLSEIGNASEHKVQYRGASWTARIENASPQLDTDYVVVRVDGAVLILNAKN